MAFKGIFPAPLIEPSQYGLLDAANVIEYEIGDDLHWTGKFDVETDACYFDSEVIDVCDPSKRVTLLDQTSDSRSRVIYPFAITAADTCSTFGFNGESRETRVLKQLAAITPKAVEREFWTGELAQSAGHTTNTWITNETGLTTVTASAVSAKRAFAALEGALANCGAGARGMIHAPRQVASLADTFLLKEMIEIDGEAKERLVTKLGTVVAAGVGYTGTDPGDDAPASNHLWIYATGLVTVHLGPRVITGEQMGQMTRTSDNTIKTEAERAAAIVWDGCCHFAAEVDLTTS